MGYSNLTLATGQIYFDAINLRNGSSMDIRTLKTSDLRKKQEIVR